MIFGDFDQNIYGPLAYSTYTAASLTSGRMTKIFFWQVHRRGWVGHWSWGKLLAELVVKFGVLGIVTHLLDAYWQFVLPLAGGRNYNEDVYRQVGGGKMKPA